VEAVDTHAPRHAGPDHAGPDRDRNSTGPRPDAPALRWAMYRRRLLCSIVLFTLGVSTAVAAQPNPVTTLAIAGCYAVTLGAWDPLEDLGEDAPFIEVPPLLEVQGSRSAWFLNRGRVVVRLARGEREARHKDRWPGSGRWEVVEDNELRLFWGAGSPYSGVHMRLHPDADGLHGVATTFWDFLGHEPQRADVQARRVSCPDR
jgi:hypothetical protein